MYTGLLKQFLKKLAGFTADTGNPVGSHKSNSQSGSKNSSLKLATTVLLSIIGCATAFPAMAALTIDSATWDGKKLIVQGADGKGGIVEVYYGYDTPANTTLLGAASVKGNGSWKLQINTNPNNPLDPVPCAVSATLAGEPDVVDFPVAGANPATCAPQPPGDNTPPVANDDDYNAITNVLLSVSAPGVLFNDTDAEGDTLTAVIVTDVSNGTLNLNSDGSFTYTSNLGFAGVDTFTYNAHDGTVPSVTAATVTITVLDIPPPPEFAPQTDFKILMNYELGMHCTGFEFAYCCVLPAYNSILAQVVKPQGTDKSDFPELLEGDPNEGLDALGRETVVRDKALGANGEFKKYVLKYWHDAQPRNDGRGKIQTSTLISAAEGNSLLSWNTIFDSAQVIDGALQYGSYNGAEGVLQGNGDLSDPTDNYQNAVWNHLYFYNGLEGEFACSAPAANEGNRCSVDADCDSSLVGDGVCNVTSAENQKIRLGVAGQPGPFPTVAYPTDCGPAFHPLGPVTTDPNDPTQTIDNTCGGFSNGNVLTFSGDKGTVVYTQMKVLENLPIMLTSPDIWEALGLPLTPFEDSIDFFGDPGLLNEDSVRPFVAMNAQMYDYDPAAPGGAGAATLDSAGNPVIGFGTAPIDIPNCERCHSNPENGTLIPNSDDESAFPGEMLTVINSPNIEGTQQWLDVQAEYNFWNAYYDINTEAGDSDWYSRLKSAAISMLTAHDDQHGTSFTARFALDCTDVTDPNCGARPQNTRLGHESVICQRCHADNVIAVVKSATDSGGALIKPITEALHNNHRGVNMLDANGIGGVVTFADSLGRDGGCQGCHPAHRSNGDMDGYPITLAGANKYAGGDNRGANGGCFVGRDVHSNLGKDADGVETPAHLNAVGQYLADNVAVENPGDPWETGNGIWCTNCHNQLSQEIWKAENMVSLVHGVPGKEADGVTDAVNIRALPSLAAIATAVGTTEEQAISWLDPKDDTISGDRPLGDDSYAIWDVDPGLCNYVAGYFGVIDVDPAHDGNVATVEVNVNSAAACSTNDAIRDANGDPALIDCGEPYPGAPAFFLCGSHDGDGDFSVNAMDFCTTPDCVAAAQTTLGDPAVTGSVAVPVPMSAATDGRDHWLSPGEPHCADCHAAPFVEQSGNINAYPPFNYPRKASLMRYSKGHQNISCQGCHESIHGLYPVTPNIDTTSYAQAAALNHDGSHGPLKCGTCHEVGANGIPTWVEDLQYNGLPVAGNFDRAVEWMHTFTAEADPRQEVCLNCHEDFADKISHAHNNKDWIEHADKGRTSRQTMDTVELLQVGHIAGDPAFENPLNTVCVACHGNKSRDVSCDKEWKEHLINGRVAEFVWENVSLTLTGSTCGW